jgi:hypothetical protein
VLGQHEDLPELMWFVADRLYLLSARPIRPRRDDSDPTTG